MSVLLLDLGPDRLPDLLPYLPHDGHALGTGLALPDIARRAKTRALVDGDRHACPRPVVKASDDDP